MIVSHFMYIDIISVCHFFWIMEPYNCTNLFLSLVYVVPELEDSI